MIRSSSLAEEPNTEQDTKFEIWANWRFLSHQNELKKSPNCSIVVPDFSIVSKFFDSHSATSTVTARPNKNFGKPVLTTS